MTWPSSMNKLPKSDAELAEPHFQHPQPQKSTPATGQIATAEPDTTQQLQDLTRRVQDLEGTTNGRIVFNTGIIGLFETVTVAPTGIPTSPYDQVKISVIAGTTALNVYDATNHVWKKVTIT